MATKLPETPTYEPKEPNPPTYTPDPETLAVLKTLETCDKPDACFSWSGEATISSDRYRTSN